MQKRYGKFQIIAFNIEILVETTKNSFLQHLYENEVVRNFAVNEAMACHL